MEWRILALLILLALTALVLHMAYQGIPVKLSQPDEVNVLYSATGDLVSRPLDASGNLWK